MRRTLLSLGLIGTFFLGGCGIFGISDMLTGAEAGVAFIKQGKYESFDEVSFEDAVIATRQAGKNLSLKPTEENIKDNGADFKFYDERKQVIAVTLQRRSKTVTATYIDVGVFGTTGMGRLMMAEIINQLLVSHSYTQTWERKQVPATGTRPASTTSDPADDVSPLGGKSGLLIPQEPGQPAIVVQPQNK